MRPFPFVPFVVALLMTTAACGSSNPVSPASGTALTVGTSVATAGPSGTQAGSLGGPASQAPAVATATTARDLLPTPVAFDLSEAGVREAMTRWIAAYDIRDEQDFLAYLTDGMLNYGDCNYETESFVALHDHGAVRQWIHRQWAEDDRLELRQIQFIGGSPPDGYQPGEPIIGVVLKVLRTSRLLPTAREINQKIVFRDPRHGGLITAAGIDGNVSCPSGPSCDCAVKPITPTPPREPGR